VPAERLNELVDEGGSVILRVDYLCIGGDCLLGNLRGVPSRPDVDRLR
jgi:hypothetical protein